LIRHDDEGTKSEIIDDIVGGGCKASGARCPFSANRGRRRVFDRVERQENVRLRDALSHGVAFCKDDIVFVITKKGVYH